MAGLNRFQFFEPPLRGLNSRFNQTTIDPQEATVLTNFEVNNKNALETYPGYVLDASAFPSSASSFIRALYNFKRGTAINYLVAAASDQVNNANTTFNVDTKFTTGNGVYGYFGHTIGTASFTASNTAVTGTNTHWSTELKAGDKIKATADADSKYTEIATVNSDTSLTLVGGGYLGSTSGGAVAYIARKIWNVTALIRLLAFNNVLVMVDGSGIPQYWDGTSVNKLINTYNGTTLTTNSLGAAPLLQGVIKHKNRLFGWLNSTLFWSQTNDQTGWDPGSNEPIFAQDGGNITACISYADSIFVFKDNGYIYRVFGNFDDSSTGTAAAIKKIDYSERLGIIASRGIFVHNYLLYFVCEAGLYQIDPRGLVQKVSYLIDPTVTMLNFNLGSQTGKSFPFTTKSQWDAGTHQGTYSTFSDNFLKTYFDDYRQTDALQGNKLCAVAIDSSSTVHIAYVPASNPKQINYVRYYTSGVVPSAGSNPQKETNILSSLPTLNIYALALSVNPSDGTVGVAYGSDSGTGVGTLSYVERSADSGSTLGIWGAPVVLVGTFSHTAVSIRHTSGGVPYVVNSDWGLPDGSTTTFFLRFFVRTSGTWSSSVIDTFALNGAPDAQQHVTIALDGSSNLYVSWVANATLNIHAYKSTNGGASWTTIETTAPISMAPNCCVSSFVDHLNNFYSVYSTTGGTIIRRNHTAATNTTIDGTANSLAAGGLTLARTVSGVTTDYFYYLNIVGVSPNQQEKYFFETSSTLTNPTANVINSSSIRPIDNPMVNNGQVIASINFGVNANELVIRRVTFYGIWTSPQDTDSTLSLWGTYEVDNQTTNGNTVQHLVGLTSAATTPTFVNITPGQTISSNATLNFIEAQVQVTLTQWANAVVNNIILNYFGSGVDAKQLFGFSYFEEAYIAGTSPGGSANNNVLVQDIRNGFLQNTYPVNCLEWFNTELYAGSSLKGDIYILKQGYLQNGSTYACDFQSKETYLEGPHLLKDLYKIYVHYQVQAVGTFTFSYRLDNASTSGGSAWTSVTIDQTSNGPGSSSILSGEPGRAEILVGQSAQSIQFRVQSTANGQSSVIFGFTLLYSYENPR